MDEQPRIFTASRFSRGNFWFPTQVEVTPTSVTLRKPHLVGKVEESVHMAHVASIKILTGWFLSDVIIESTSGKDPLVPGVRTGSGNAPGAAVGDYPKVAVPKTEKGGSQALMARG